MSSRLASLAKISLFIFILVSIPLTKVFATGDVQVNKEKKKTIITISGFPKNVTVLVVDESFNLLSAGTTNNLGVAQITIKKQINSIITVRTINGDYEVTNRPRTREEELREIMADNKLKKALKA